MTLHRKLAKDSFERLSDADEKAFRNQWAIDGLDKPRIRGEQGKDVILTAEEITAIEAEWAEAARPRTAAEIDATVTTEATRAIGKNKLIKLIALVFFNHENRIRILEGKAEIDMPTFKQTLIDRYKLI